MRRCEVEGNLVDVLDGRIFPARLAIVEDKVSSIEPVNGTRANYILPGLIDAHIHIESSLLSPSRFAEAALAHGTTAVVADPHEIANVLGMEGVMYMVKEAKGGKLRIFFAAPSCVPLVIGQDYGGRLSWKEVQELLAMEQFVALGEVMDDEGVLAQDGEIMAKLEVAKMAGKPIDGHAPGMNGNRLDSYVMAGITTDHECTSSAEALEKFQKGMTIMVREGSAAKNLEALMPFAKDHQCFLVCDDLSALDLEKGHLDTVLRQAVALGMDPVHAIRAVTLWPAKHYHLPGGVIREGGPADLIVVKDLQGFQVLETWVDGEMVAMNGSTMFCCAPNPIRPGIAITKVEGEDLRLRHPGTSVKVRYQLASPDQIIGGRGEGELQVLDGVVQADPMHDILLLAVVNRYKKGAADLGFVRGFGIRAGAIASSVAHDAHNLIAVGTSPEDMAVALSQVIAHGGGYCAFDGLTPASLPLPLAGLMSDRPIGEVAKAEKAIREFVAGMGCRLPSPFMTLSFQDPRFRRAVLGVDGYFVNEQPVESGSE